MARVTSWLQNARWPVDIIRHGLPLLPAQFSTTSAQAAMPGLVQDSQKASPLAVVGHWVRFTLRLGGQCLILCLLFGAGTVIAETFSLPLPGNLVGLLLLLLLLSAGVLRPADLRDIAALVSKHLNFFFIPLVVGLMAWTGLLAASGLVLLISLVGSAIIGIATAGLVAAWLGRTTRTNDVL